jgi:hypothetical protein
MITGMVTIHTITTIIIIIRTDIPLQVTLTEEPAPPTLQVLTMQILQETDHRGTTIIMVLRQMPEIVQEGEILEAENPATEIMETAVTQVTTVMPIITAIAVIIREEEIREEEIPVTEITVTAVILATMAMLTTMATTVLIPMAAIMAIMEITAITQDQGHPTAPVSLKALTTGKGTAAETALPMPVPGTQGQRVNPMMPIPGGIAIPLLQIRT